MGFVDEVMGKLSTNDYDYIAIRKNIRLTIIKDSVDAVCKYCGHVYFYKIFNTSTKESNFFCNKCHFSIKDKSMPGEFQILSPPEGLESCSNIVRGDN